MQSRTRCLCLKTFRVGKSLIQVRFLYSIEPLRVRTHRGNLIDARAEIATKKSSSLPLILLFLSQERRRTAVRVSHTLLGTNTDSLVINKASSTRETLRCVYRQWLKIKWQRSLRKDLTLARFPFSKKLLRSNGRRRPTCEWLSRKLILQLAQKRNGRRVCRSLCSQRSLARASRAIGLASSSRPQISSYFTADRLVPGPKSSTSRQVK